MTTGNKKLISNKTCIIMRFIDNTLFILSTHLLSAAKKRPVIIYFKINPV